MEFSDHHAFAIGSPDLQDVILLLAVQRLNMDSDQREIADLIISEMLKVPDADIGQFSITWLNHFKPDDLDGRHGSEWAAIAANDKIISFSAGNQFTPWITADI